MMRRRRRDFVVDGAPDAIVAEHFQAGGVGILAIFHDPKPAALVEIEEERLRNVRLGEHQIDRQVVRRFEARERFLGSQRSVAALCRLASGRRSRSRRRAQARPTLRKRDFNVDVRGMEGRSSIVWVSPQIGSLRPTNRHETGAATAFTDFWAEDALVGKDRRRPLSPDAPVLPTDHTRVREGRGRRASKGATWLGDTSGPTARSIRQPADHIPPLCSALPRDSRDPWR